MNAVLSPAQIPPGNIFMSTLQKKKRAQNGGPSSQVYKSKSMDTPPPPGHTGSSSNNGHEGFPPPPSSPPPPVKQHSLDSSFDGYRAAPPPPSFTLPRGQHRVPSLDQVPETGVGHSSAQPRSPLSPGSSFSSGSGIFQSTLQRRQRRVNQQTSEVHTAATSPKQHINGSSGAFPLPPKFPYGYNGTGGTIPRKPHPPPLLKSSTATLPSSPRHGSGPPSPWASGQSPPSSPGSSLLSPPPSEFGSGSSGIFMSTLQRKTQGKCQGPTCMMSRNTSMPTLPRPTLPSVGSPPPTDFMTPPPKKMTTLFPDSEAESDEDDRVAAKPWAVPSDSDEELPRAPPGTAASINKKRSTAQKGEMKTPVVSNGWDVPSDSDDDSPVPSRHTAMSQHPVSSAPIPPPPAHCPPPPPPFSETNKHSPKPFHVKSGSVSPISQRSNITPPAQVKSYPMTRSGVLTVPPSPTKKVGNDEDGDFPPPPPMSAASQMGNSHQDEVEDIPLPPPPATAIPPPSPAAYNNNNGDFSKTVIPPPPPCFNEQCSDDSDDVDAPPIPPKDASIITESTAPITTRWDVPDDSDSDSESGPTTEWARRHSEDSGMLEASVPRIVSQTTPPMGSNRGALAAATAGRIGSSAGAPEPITMYYNSIKKGTGGGSLIGSDMEMHSPTDHSSGFDSKSSIVSDDDSSYVPSLQEYERSPDATIDVNDLPLSKGGHRMNNNIHSGGNNGSQSASGKAKRTIVTEETREFVPEESTDDKLVERIVHTQTITEQVAPGTAPVLYKEYGGEDFAKYLEDDDEFVKFIHENGQKEEKKKGRKRGDEPLFIDPFKNLEPTRPVKMTTPVEKQTVKQTITTLIRKKKSGPPASKMVHEPTNYHGSENALNLTGRRSPNGTPKMAPALNNFTYTDSKIGADSVLSASDDDHLSTSTGGIDPSTQVNGLPSPTGASANGKARSFWNLEQLGCKQSEACGEVTLGRGFRKGKSLDDDISSHQQYNDMQYNSPTRGTDDPAMLFAAAASGKSPPFAITTLQRQKAPKAAKVPGGKGKGFKGLKFWKKNTEKVKVNPLSHASLGSSEEGDYAEFGPGEN